MPFYRVVVPLDGSKLAEAALERATCLVNALGHIMLVTAIDNEAPKIAGIPIYPWMGMGLAYLKASAEERLEWQKEYLLHKVARLQARGFKADFDIRYGSPAEVIVHAAEDFAADVIVMSSHGRSGISRQIIGSVAGCVLRAAGCPVMVIPCRAKKARSKEAVAP